MQDNTHNMLEAVLFTKVNLINAAGGALLVVLFSPMDILHGYTAIAGALSITALLAYNTVKFWRLMINKEKED